MSSHTMHGIWQDKSLKIFHGTSGGWKWKGFQREEKFNQKKKKVKFAENFLYLITNRKIGQPPESNSDSVPVPLTFSLFFLGQPN